MMMHQRPPSRSTCPTPMTAVLLAVVLSLVAPGRARANPSDDGATAETLGMADAVRASTWGPAALVWNPAGLLRVPALLAQANYRFLDGEDGQAFSAGLVDGRTSPFSSLGVQYTWVDATRDGVRREGHQVRVGLGTGYRSGEFGLFGGVGARYLSRDLTTAGATAHLEGWTVDLGFILDFADRIRFGVTGQNLGQNLLTLEAPDTHATLGLGLSLVFGSLDVGATLDLDLAEVSRATDGTPRTVKAFAFGADYGLGDAVRLRGGLSADALTERRRLTAGLGWSTPSLGLDVGWSTALVDPADMIFSLSLRLLPSP
jgi:hypothetical protein